MVSHNSENRTLSLQTASAVAQLLGWLLRWNPEEQYNIVQIYAVISSCVGTPSESFVMLMTSNRSFSYGLKVELCMYSYVTSQPLMHNHTCGKRKVWERGHIFVSCSLCYSPEFAT